MTWDALLNHLVGGMWEEYYLAWERGTASGLIVPEWMIRVTKGSSFSEIQTYLVEYCSLGGLLFRAGDDMGTQVLFERASCSVV